MLNLLLVFYIHPGKACWNSEGKPKLQERNPK